MNTSAPPNPASLLRGPKEREQHRETVGHNTMSDLGTQLASANSSENTSGTQDSSANDGEADFVPNQTSDYYFVFRNPKRIGTAMLETLGAFEVRIENTFDLTREDIPRIREQAESEGWHPFEAKVAIDSAMASWLGDRQANENEDFGMGLEKDDDNNVVGYYEGQYGAYFGETVPTIEVEELDAGEVADLEDYGIDAELLGSRPEGTPRYPVFTEGRYPVFVDSYDDLDECIEMLNEVPDEPSLGNVEAPEGVDVLEGTIEDLEDYIESEQPDDDTLEAMLEAEQANKDRKGARQAIEDALDADSEGTQAGNRYSQYEDGDSDESSTSDDAVDEETAKEKADAVATLVDSGYDKDEAREMVFGA